MNLNEKTLDFLMFLSTNVSALLVFYLLYKDLSYTKFLVARQEELIGKVTQLLEIFSSIAIKNKGKL